MFTREQWKGDFHKCCQPGEEISEDLYWYFLELLPPINLGSGAKMCGFQVSEPHDHVVCTDGKMRARYPTFGTNNGKFYYLGIFTKGRTDNDNVRL